MTSSQSYPDPKAPSAPVDRAHLSRYTLGNAQLERDVLELFSTQSAAYLAKLKVAGNDKDWCEAAHSLKGSARAIGAWRLAEAAERAEALGPKPITHATLIMEVQGALDEARAYIGALLKDG